MRLRFQAQLMKNLLIAKKNPTYSSKWQKQHALSQGYSNFLWMKNASRLVYTHINKEKIVAHKLIELNDGTLVEIEIPGDQVEQISGGMAEKVNTSLESLKPLLVNTCKPVAEVWEELNKDMKIDSAEIELGISFEGEGNLYIAKASAKANLTLKLIIKPNKEKNIS